MNNLFLWLKTFWWIFLYGIEGATQKALDQLNQERKKLREKLLGDLESKT